MSPLPEVGRLGLGCACIGNLYRPVSDEDAQAVVDAAWDLGIRLVDTAPLYGHGLSETRLGVALRGRPRDEYVLATKVGRLLVPDDPARPPPDTIFAAAPRLHPRFDYSRDGVLRSIEESLGRLDTDRLDLVHVHDPDDHLDQAIGEAYPALLQLRDEGVIGAVGLGTNDPAVGSRVVAAVDLDRVLLANAYTLLDQRAGADLFPRCQAAGIPVIAAGVFSSGILANPSDDATYFYAPAPPEVLARARALQQACADHGVPLAAAALQLPLRHPAVATILIGPRDANELKEDAHLLEMQIPDELWQDLVDKGLLKEDPSSSGASP